MEFKSLRKHTITKDLRETIDMLYKVAKKEDDIQLAIQAREILFYISGYLLSITNALKKE